MGIGDGCIKKRARRQAKNVSDTLPDTLRLVQPANYKLDIRLQDETVWLTQQLIAELFHTTVPNIRMHIRNISKEGELTPEATHKKSLSVRQGSRNVQRALDCYNLDMILSVGYRVKSHVATRFRIWATQRLKEYIIKDFVLDELFGMVLCNLSLPSLTVGHQAISS